MTKLNSPLPANEKERLEALLSYNILDTLSEGEYDNITKLASHICQVPIASISFIDDSRLWFKSRVGIDDPEAPREISFCQYTIMNDEIFEVTDTLKSEIFKDNPFVTGKSSFRFYAGAPLITPDGFNIGTLCLYDKKP